MRSVTAKKCSECGSKGVMMDYEVGEVVCEQCGFVISSTPLVGSERIAYNMEQREKRTRVGAPLTWAIHDKGLSTVIDWNNKDIYGRMLNSKERARFNRLRRWHRRCQLSNRPEINLSYALSELTKISKKLNLPRNVLETASLIYRRMVLKGLIRGRSIRVMVAASIYMACRQCKVIRALNEVVKTSHITKKEGGRNYRFLLKKMKEKVPLINAKYYISKLVNQLTLTGDTERIAMKILDLAVELKLTSGKSHAGIAAAVTYIASKLASEKRTQAEIARSAHVTEVTLRNRYKELWKRIEIEILL